MSGGDGSNESDSPDEPMPGDIEPDVIPWEEFAHQAEEMIKALHWRGYEEQAEQLREIKALFEMRNEERQDVGEKRFPHSNESSND